MFKRFNKVTSSLLALLMVAVMATGLTACYDDPYDGPDDWYLSGTYANDDDYTETYTFYSDGTGVYSDYDGRMDFDYYCLGSSIYFTFYPYYGAPYSLNCGLTTVGRRSLIITYPPGNGFGYTSQSYTLVSW